MKNNYLNDIIARGGSGGRARFFIGGGALFLTHICFVLLTLIFFNTIYFF